MLWPDTFTDHFDPDVARAAVQVLESAGFRVAVPREAVCCGLTWISTGQLGVTRRRLQAAVAALRPWTGTGTLVVGLEPSCTAVFRSDAPELLPGDPDVARLQGRFVTLAEALLLHAPRYWQPRRLDRKAIVQVHCHQHAVLGTDADREVLRRAGIDAETLDSGCCGLAGDFGFEAGHYLSTPLVEGLSLLLWSFGTWTIPLLVIFGAWRHVVRRDRLAYTPHLWAMVFPLGMYSVATAEFGRVTGLPFLTVPARVAFWVALVAWVAVFAAMLVSLAAGSGRRTAGKRLDR